MEFSSTLPKEVVLPGYTVPTELRSALLPDIIGFPQVFREHLTQSLRSDISVWRCIAGIKIGRDVVAGYLGEEAQLGGRHTSI